MEDLSYQISRREDGAVVLRLLGELDLNVRDEVRDGVLAAVAQAGPSGVVLDFAGTDFIESEAMGALIDGLSAARLAGIPFTAVNATGIVHRVLQVSGVLDLFNRAG